MADVTAAFLMAAGVVFAGFAAARLFQATRFPDTPVLLALGLLLGPLNRFAVDHGVGISWLAQALDPETLRPLAPFVSALALMVILFDSGLRLDFGEFRRGLRPAFLHTLPIFLLTVLGVTLVARAVFGMPILVSAILGVALSNVGQTVSAAIIRDVRMAPEVRSMYFAEMAIYDLVSIPLLASMLAFAEAGGGAEGLDRFVQGFAQLVAVSVFIGAVGGFLWVLALRRLKDRPYAYMLTLAALLGVYAVNQDLGGSGAVSVLLFGLVVGNRRAILAHFADGVSAGAEDPRVHDFHEEITFLVRTFFFLFLGINFSTGLAGVGSLASPLWPLSRLAGTAALFLLGVLLILAAIVAMRYLCVRHLSMRGHPERRALFLVYGRGLGTAVLAALPFLQPAYEEGTAYFALFSPWEAVFLNTALLIVLLTVLSTSIGVWRHETRVARPRPGPGPPPGDRTVSPPRPAAVEGPPTVVSLPAGKPEPPAAPAGRGPGKGGRRGPGRRR